MNNHDSLDKHLVKLLEKDALQSSKALAQQLNVSSATVRRRLKALIKDGTMRIVAVVDPARIGVNLVAVIAFNVRHHDVEPFVEKLSTYQQVKWISITTGRFDVMAVAVFSSTDQLSAFLQKDIPTLEGVANSETFICLQVKKGRYVQV